ncbi:lectin C-type domain protein [Ostertagia ostertagi]
MGHVLAYPTDAVPRAHEFCRHKAECRDKPVRKISILVVACPLENHIEVMRVKLPFWISRNTRGGLIEATMKELIQDVDFKQWAPNYPDSQQGDCVRMEYSKAHNTGLWFNEFCTKDLLYICQIVACSTDHYCPVVR